MWGHEKNWACSQLCYGMEYTSTRNRQKPSFNHFWSCGYLIIWSKIPIQGLSPIMNSGTKAWAFQYQSSKRWFCWVIVFSPANSQMVTMKPGLVGMDNIQWIYAVVVNSFHDLDLRRSNPGPTRQTGPVHHHPSGGLCAFIHPASCRWMRSCWWPDHARQLGSQGTRHLALCLDLTRQNPAARQC